MDRDPLEAIVECAAMLLVVLRLLVPPESSVLGQTLWISQLWFAAAALAILARLRSGTLSFRADLLDVGVGILVLAHVTSALRVIVLHDGDRRAALNMLWEWVALGVSFPLLRSALRSDESRRRWMTIFVTLAVAKSALGLYQHYVWYPKEVAKYARLRDELDSLESGQAAAGDDAFARGERMIALQQEFAQLGIPTDKAGRSQFEGRLRNSTEPMGLFALANTLAGWLLVWLIVGMGMSRETWRVVESPPGRNPSSNSDSAGAKLSGGNWRRWFVAGSLVVVAYCLVLTKSRTAWIGLAAGLCVWRVVESRKRRSRAVRPALNASEAEEGAPAIPHVRPSDGDAAAAERPAAQGMFRSRRWLAVSGGVLIAVLAAGWVAARTGGFDKEVILEAPKSLRYRIQYWRGTFAMLRNHALWGVGPGNFRQHYLRYKLPEASEEIADPHNILLDLWTSGGVLAIVGLTVAVVGAGRQMRHAAESAAGRGSAPVPWGICESGALAALIGLALLDFLVRLDTFSAGRTLALGAGWLVLMAIAGGLLRRGTPSTGCLLGGAAALTIHLMGAGGAEMPAITQTAFVLAIFLTAPAASPLSPGIPRWRLVGLGSMLILGALFAGCLLTSTIPVFRRDVLLLEGDIRVARGREEGAYRLAAEIDPLSPEPFQHLATMTTLRAGVTVDRSVYERAISLEREAIARDPHNAQRYRRLAEIQCDAFRRTTDREFLDAGIESYQKAAELYPHFAQLRADYAEALRVAGRHEEFQRQGRRALELDAINRKARHRDKYLPDETVQKLRSTAL